MTFQFLCPQGHLLQGEEADMGMQCQCPQCGMAFIIPTVERPAHGSVDDLTAGVEEQQDEPAQLDALGDFFPGDPAPAPAQGGFDVAGRDLGVAPLGRGAGEGEGETLLHIPCPNGHELDTPLSMIGLRAMCPHCRVEFRLRREKSVEYLQEQEERERQRAEFWFRAAIIAAGLVGLTLLVMVAMSFLS